jgi:DMSO/TMAO reductase YedYZ molybdopterin-dependent catalytic subunit
MIGKSLKLKPVSDKPFNAETPFAALRSKVTPSDLFYVRNHFDVPSLDINLFSLKINGAAGIQKEFSIQQLKEFPERDLLVVMECAGNGRASMNPTIKGTPWNLGAISQANFTGTSLHNILESVGYTKDAIEVRFTGIDQGKVRTGRTEKYVRSLPLEVALHEDTILAWQMNGEPLPLQHGFPLRLVVPSWYGMASVKWLGEITILTEPFEGFFQTKEYVYVSEDGTAEETPVSNIRVRSLILEPADGSAIKKDMIQISGVAWTGSGTIAKVEIRFDQGADWIEVKIEPPTSPFGIYRWKHLWQPESA